MNGWTTTKVFRINGKLYIGRTVEDAIALFRTYTHPVDVIIKQVEMVIDDTTASGDAIIAENDTRAAESIAILSEENEKLKAAVRALKEALPKWRKHRGKASMSPYARWIKKDTKGTSVASTLFEGDDYLEISDLAKIPVND